MVPMAEGGYPRIQYGGGYITKIKERNSDEFGLDVGRRRGGCKQGSRRRGGNVSYKGLTFGPSTTIRMTSSTSSIRRVLTSSSSRTVSAFSSQPSTRISGAWAGPAEWLFLQDEPVWCEGDMSYGGRSQPWLYERFQWSGSAEPWSGYPGYTACRYRIQPRRGECLYCQDSYDFTNLGLKGVTAYSLFVHGTGRIDPSTKSPVAGRE